MREIGLHLRLTTTLLDLFKQALALKLSAFQCFLIAQEDARFYQPTMQEIQDCRALRGAFGHLYVHGSYWINLAASHAYRQRAFKREIGLAKALGFTHFIMHPGSAKGAKNRTDAIIALARTLDQILAVEDTIKIVLENVAHGGMAIGGDLADFKLLKEKVTNPEKLYFCIDTAHAYSYGYDIADAKGQNEFVQLLENSIGIASIALIHLNDTTERLGSKIDKHSFVGQGNLGLDALRSFVNHTALAHIPLLMELPVASQQEEKDILATVQGWHT